MVPRNHSHTSGLVFIFFQTSRNISILPYKNTIQFQKSVWLAKASSTCESGLTSRNWPATPLIDESQEQQLSTVVEIDLVQLLPEQYLKI